MAMKLQVFLLVLCGSIGLSLQNEFVTDAAGTPNIRGGIHCTYTDVDAFKVYLTMYEPDYTLADDNGDRIIYQCRLLDESLLPNRMEITDKTSATCGGTDIFPVLATQDLTTAGPVNNAKQRTHQKIIGPFDPSLSGSVCGGEKNSLVYTFAVNCYENPGSGLPQFDTSLETLVHLTINTGSDCIAETADAVHVTVDNPSETEIVRDYLVTFDIYQADSRDLSSFYEEKSPANKKVTTPVALGTTLYAEACIAIDGAGDDGRLYFVDGVSVLGMSVTNCVASHKTGEDYFGDSNLAISVIDGNGCGKGVSPMKAWATSVYQFQYAHAEASPYPNMKWFTSPNCFRTVPFEAVSFHRKDILDDSTVVLTCDVSYCQGTSDADCFGAGGADDTDYSSSCPSSGRRKRRSTVDNSNIPAYFPRQVTFNYTVIPNILTANNQKRANFDNGCLERPVYIGLSSVVGGLLLLIVLADILLGCKIMHRSEEDISVSGASHSSRVGFENKGYY